MLHYSTKPSRTKLSPLTAEEDLKLRRAFGKFAEWQYRNDGAKIVSAHYEKQRWFHCDCRPDMQRPPTLFLVNGTHIKREDDGDGTPHTETCDFIRYAHEQKKLTCINISSDNDARPFNLLHNFGDEYASKRSYTSSISFRDPKPKLARVLFRLLKKAQLNCLDPTTPLRSGKEGSEKQKSDLKLAAQTFPLVRGRWASYWLATSLKEYYVLKRRLEQKPDDWQRPHGLFIEAFNRIEDNVLYPTKEGQEPIPVTGQLAIFGESGTMCRPPYMVIGVLGYPTREAHKVELINAYAHPCVAWDRLIPVDSQLERETFGLLVSCRDWLLTNHNIKMTIEKPLFDIKSEKTSDLQALCKPDFILRCQNGGKTLQKLVVIETMGYDVADYRERKTRMRPLFEHIYNNHHPVPIIEHDRFKPMSPKEADSAFKHDVCRTIIGLYEAK